MRTPAFATDSRLPIPDSGADSRLASAVSYLVNPFLLPPLLFGLIVAHFGGAASEIGRVVLISFCCFALAPLLFILRMVRRGEAASVELHARGARTRPLLAALGSGAAAVALLAWTSGTAAPLPAAVAGCYLANGALALLVNLRWKISLHLMTAGGFFGVLLFVLHAPLPHAPLPLLSEAAVYAALPLLPLLMWARVRLGAHTPAQVVAGAAAGLALPWIELRLLLGLLA